MLVLSDMPVSVGHASNVELKAIHQRPRFPPFVVEAFLLSSMRSVLRPFTSNGPVGSGTPAESHMKTRSDQTFVHDRRELIAALRENA